MKITAQNMALATGGLLQQDGPPGNFQFDTRILQSGQWFLALRGARDGHDFIPIAEQQDCAGIIGQHVPSNWNRGFIEVPDTLVAFQDIARFVRTAFTGPVIGITGSAGKTTTRALIGCLFENLGIVHQTKGNFNNHIGVPKTITDAPENAVSWILEMGMNALGEIDLLQNIAKPTIRLITNIGAAHVEGCGSIEGVAQAKGELFAGAQPEDTCCINLDDPRVAALPNPDGVHKITYGTTPNCDIQLRSVQVDGELCQTNVQIQTPCGNIDSFIPIPGEFMALNACAAVAAGYAAGIPLAEMAKGLQQYKPVGDRMSISNVGETRFINDSYNANTLSMKAALNSVATLQSKETLVLLGDMLEMGTEEGAAHIEILEVAISMGFQIGIVGPRFHNAYLSLSRQQQEKISWQSQSSTEMSELINALPKTPRTILLKGSRGMTMEKILTNYSGDSHD